MSLTKDTPEFGAVTSFDGDAATIALRGRVENGAAFALGAILDAAIDRHPASIALDAAELEYVGPTGLLAVSNAEKRLAELGIALTIRTPSASVNALVAIMELAEVSRPVRPLPRHEHLGPEQSGERDRPTQGAAPSLRMEDLRRMTALPADPDVIDGALRLIVELARVSIAGADGVSVSLLRHGELSTVAASDQTIMAMDADQYSTGQGPCVDASVKGHWFHAESLDTETRWPAFTPQARRLGIRSILSSPLRAFEKPVGALNIYSRTADSFEVKDQESAAVFAQQASVILSDARAGVSDTQMAFRFQEALRSREVITLAKGIIMGREGIDAESASKVLLRLALAQELPLRERAETIVRWVEHPAFGSKGGPDD
jgi:anti-anti-sigma regulatory factor